MSDQTVTSYYNEGLEHTKAGNWDEALECFRKAIDEDPRHVNSYNALGKVYHHKGESDEARRCWRTALKIDSKNRTARQCLEAAGKAPIQIQAKAMLWVAVVIVLVLVALIITNVILLQHISKLKAELELAKATAFDAQSSKPEPQDSAVQKDQQIQADKPVEETITQSPPAIKPPAQITQPVSPAISSDIIEVYAQALADCRSGWYDQATKGFQRVLKHPSSYQLKDNAQYWLAECYYAKQDYTRALAEFQKVKGDYPKANKVFDAELKIAYTYYSLENIKQAEQKILQLNKSPLRSQYQPQINALSEKIRLSKTK